ncbi:MAG: hypothetical protein HC933_14110 [Pleurocapsa sp. SU_196_0]|nr:hypothetical protein [Pleurocapsa sp. SU_196_0]
MRSHENDLTEFYRFGNVRRLSFTPSPRSVERAPNREKAGGSMQTQWTQNMSESEVVARLLAQMEHAKWQATELEDSSEELETWEWEGGATLH